MRPHYFQLCSLLLFCAHPQNPMPAKLALISSHCSLILNAASAEAEAIHYYSQTNYSRMFVLNLNIYIQVLFHAMQTYPRPISRKVLGQAARDDLKTEMDQPVCRRHFLLRSTSCLTEARLKTRLQRRGGSMMRCTCHSQGLTCSAPGPTGKSVSSPRCGMKGVATEQSHSCP